MLEMLFGYLAEEVRGGRVRLPNGKKDWQRVSDNLKFLIITECESAFEKIWDDAIKNELEVASEMQAASKKNALGSWGERRDVQPPQLGSRSSSSK